MARSILIWAALSLAIGVPIALAAASPLLAWRDWIYIAAGFAGIIALALMLIQPLLIAGVLPGLTPYRGRRVHHWIGGGLVVAILAHVGGLYLTSPPDVVDALTLASPTPFSVWGVTAMWAVLAVALVSLVRKRLPLRAWRIGHTILAVVIVLGTVIHSVLIEGAMETFSKAALCALVIVAMVKAIADLRVWRKRVRGTHTHGPMN